MAQTHSAGRRPDSRRPDRTPAARGDTTEKVVFINRCAKVVKGGRRFSFSALIVAGDHDGKVGCGFGKANEVSEAIRKASEAARKAMEKVSLNENTIPHEVIGEYDGARVLLRHFDGGKKFSKCAEFISAMEKVSNIMRLHNLQPRPGSRHRVKRLGCGESSGHGKTSGKGHKGQKARSGGSIRLGFEGGQMPLIRRLPKRGFNNAAFHKRYAIVNLDELNAFKAGTAVNEQLLRESKLIRGHFVGIKILGGGELKHGLKVEADKVSAAAREKIEKAGGTITIRDKEALKAAGTHVAAANGTSAEQPADEAASKATVKKKSPRKTSAKAKKKAPRKS